MTVLVSDSFNRADSTTTLGTTDSFNGGTTKTWTALTGTWGISSNQAYIATHVVDDLAVVDAGVSDCSVQSTFATTGSNLRLMFRVVDSSNLFLVQSTATQYQLFRRLSGSYGSIGSVTQTPVSGDIVKVTVNGSSITVYINGVQKITATDTNFLTATKHGLGANGTVTSFRWDNFQIDDLSTGGTNATITAVAATATNSAIAPTVTAQQNATVTSVIASSIADGIAPTVSAQKQVTISSVVANAIASAIIPVVGVVTSVNSVVASANAQAVPPTITTQRQVAITAVVASSNAAAIAPTASIVQPNVTIQSVIASAVAMALAPTVLLNFSAIVRRVSISGSGEHASIHGEPSNMKRTFIDGEVPASPQTKRTIIGGEV